ncbi:MAG: Na/Pi cotransporter family protein [Rhodospirillaceae bacterium]|nr:Na/Pi cotransporter family protein [Rhodospirillaceae bacterium]
MLRRLLLPIIFAILAYGFWISPNVKEVAAGIAIFLFGMLFLEEGFRTFAGGFLERFLKRTMDGMWKSIAFGIVSSAITQSSSLVSIVAISFLSAGLIWLSSGIGIILGANIGTTTGAWLVAGLGLKVNLAAYAMPMLAFGIVLVLQKSSKLKGIGYVLSGLGFLFLGIHYMKEGFEAFRETVSLAEYAISGFGGLVTYVLIGMAATVVMQSSHATLVLIITALAASQVTYENALAVAIGSNIGTTITAIIGSMSANYQGKQLAAAHFIFNVVTSAIAIVFISQLIWIVDDIANFIGIAADDYTMKLAVFHTTFNVIGLVVMIPLVPRLVKLLHVMIPRPRTEFSKPRYINVSAFDFPETLLEAVRKETIHLYDNAFAVMAHGLNLHRSIIISNIDLEEYVTSNRELMELDIDRIYQNKVKTLYADILEFISTAQTQLPPDHATRLFELRAACIGIVSSVKGIKHLRKNIMIYTRSDNEDIRHEYNKLRSRVARVMREINHLKRSKEEDRDILTLDEFKVESEKNSIIATGELDTLIREQRITAAMATSLMNDLGYAHSAIWQLTDVAKALFGAKDAHSKSAEDMVTLTKDGVDEMRQNKETDT